MVTPLTPEKLQNLRRLRKARRLYKQTPLFAYQLMQQEYPNYSYAKFMDDLRRRTKKKIRKKKSPLVIFGRYWRIDKLMVQFRSTKDFTLLEMAIKLRKNITKPYRMLVKLKGECMEFTFSPFTPIERIEQLNERFKQCTTQEEIEKVFNDFKCSAHLQ